MTHVSPGRAGAIEPRGAGPAHPQKRHSTFARLVGAAGLVLLTSVLFWMLTDDAFRVTDASVSFEGLAHADEAVVREHLTDLDRGPNVFRVRASDIVSELSTLTEVDAASARLTLPASLTVGLDERDPVFIWSNGALSWLVDEEGMLFAPADEATATAVRAATQSGTAVSDGATPDDGAGTADGDGATPDDGAGTAETDAADAAAAAGASDEPAAELTLTARAVLPIVEDARVHDSPTVGMYLRPTDLRVMRLLLAITPELLGSQAESLTLRVDETGGYVLRSDRGWRAIFGHYTPTLQPPDVIPQQVQCLQWLLASEERKLKEVWLALSDGACGTYSKID